MKLTQTDKNFLYSSLEYTIIKRLDKVASELATCDAEQLLEELDEIKDNIKLYQKLSKDNWFFG